MAEYVTESGLLVTDRRTRSAPNDPRGWPPNDNGAGPNDPPVSVGPTSSTNAPGNFILEPPPVQAWSGWPVEWDTPRWGDAVGGIAAMAARVSVVFGAIDLNASILSTMPPYRTQGGAMTPNLPWMSNPQPDVYSGWIEAMKQVVASYLGCGEAFLWATSRYADNSVRSWVMLNPDWVRVTMVGQIRRYSMYDVDITPDILHIRYSSWPGNPHGVGPLEALTSNLFGAAALEKYQAGLAVRGGIPWGVLTVPGNLSADQATTLRENYVRARMSAAGAPAVLSGGATLTPLYINPKDMALLELRQFDEGRIATLLGVPPTLLGLPSGAGSMTYANTRDIYDFHWRSSLKPKAAAITQAISHWALPNGQTLELNRDEYVRPPLKERLDAWAVAFNMYDPATGQRLLSLEQIRIMERFISITDDATPIGVLGGGAQ